MSKIQSLLSEAAVYYGTIDYKKVVEQRPWIIQPNQKCVLSPDSDGLLCGLLMSHYLNWEIVGYYDGKVMVLDKNCTPKDVVFLDMEICRKEIKSIGHHMLIFNKKYFPLVKEKFSNCIQPNLMRNYDAKVFRLKYPLATIHLLIGILDNTLKKIELSEKAICPLFFTDGTFNVLFSYPENVLDWLKYLRANETDSALHFLFENDKYTVIALMRAMDEFFRKRDEISISKERGDRLRISAKDGEPFNIETEANGDKKLNEEAKNRTVSFIKLLSETTGWNYKPESWLWNRFAFYKFTKGDFTGAGKRLNGKTFEEFLNRNPLSWAMTSGDNIEFTLEEPSKMV
ncbi:MAG: hypothetical protein K1X63_03525 [Chitinophagales bacterium]|nr:hypothetical protein [Chitinophagales bacterium]